MRIKGFLRNGAAGTLTSGGGPKHCPYPSRLPSGWAWPSPPEPDPNPSTSSRPRRFVLAAPSAIADVFSSPIPRSWGATPVAAEVGCGGGELHRSRRLAFANLDLGGSALVEGCTGKASTILTSSAPARRGHPRNRPRHQGPPALAAINRGGE